MNKQYSLIYVLPFCIEMIIMQYDTNEFVVFDRLIKRINIEEDLKNEFLSKKNIFKMLNIIYGYKNVISENGLNECLIIIDEDLNRLNNIDNLFNGFNKIFNKKVNIIKSMNKNYLFFLFLNDIFKNKNYKYNSLIRFEHNIFEIYVLKNEKLIEYKKVKLFEKKINRLFEKRENSIREITNGIEKFIKLKQININVNCQNNILIVNYKEYKFLNKIFKKNNINKNKFNKIMKKIFNMKYHEIKNFYNMTDEEVEKFLYIISVFEIALNDNNYNIEIKKFDISWYYTRELTLEKKELDHKNKYYEFLYEKFIANNRFNKHEISYLNKITTNVAKIQKNCYKLQKKKYILLKIIIVFSLYNIDTSFLNDIGFLKEECNYIIKWIELLKIEKLLSKNESIKCFESDNLLHSIYLIYYIMILKKSRIAVKVKKNEQKLMFKIKKENLTIFEMEILNCIKSRLKNNKQSNIIISFY
ncbi:hypothetical protein [Oceanirhabdus sp. W0125-5]|uniref:hypothetical protein n=1 Tax=Oceanirhabdus sp. W0125-5 TaxID=2999116 RepID=UPI0022F2FE01|nr:hypothetical protein [Oceanirhabdus sp. W0125-5]WBW97520.1 hypothetical protein OW730_01430 [Oceanirhabdus sp. W0125-5]